MEKELLTKMSKMSGEELYRIGELIKKGDIDCLEDGTPNYKLAAKHYKSAIDAGFVPAMYALGMLHESGYLKTDGKINYKIVIRSYKSAIEKSEYAPALFALARLYEKGHTNFEMEPDYDRAIEYYKRAIKKGYFPALEALKVLFLNKKISEDEDISIIDNYKKDAKNGSSLAMFVLGFLYESIGDYKNAEIFYIKAADKGFGEALCNLVNLYLDGRLPNDQGLGYDAAIENFKKAADMGSVKALRNLGILYEQGKGTKDSLPDYFAAKRCYEEASNKGSSHATCNLGSLYANGYITDDRKPDYKKAAEYFKQASDKGYPKASFYLGILYKNGYITENKKPNYTKAAEYFKNAADAGYDKAKEHLEKIMETHGNEIKLFQKRQVSTNRRAKI